MSRRMFFVFALIASLAFATRPASAQEPCNTDFRTQLLQAAGEAGVAVNPDDIATSVGEGVTVATTTIAGYETVPVSALPGGVNAGFLYLDAVDSGIPKGFYTVRASANAPTIGEFPGKVDLVSSSGEVVASLPATVDAFSLEVPNPLPFPRTTILQGLERTDDATGSISRARRGWRITITIRCPNGATIRITIRW